MQYPIRIPTMIRYFLLLSTMLSSLFLLAQQPQISEIRLLDQETDLPIEQAYFEYGTTKGISDENGTLAFSYVEGTSMQLSHMNYGTWTINSQELYTAISEGFYHRKSVYQTLFPVTIIAVKPQSAQPEEALAMTYPDRLEHDAGDILNQVPAFNSIRKGGNYGFEPVFRGFKYDQLNVVMNGAQSATAACPNRMDPPTSQMAPNMMERIEVLKGPHALRYGTGFGATLNFIPAKLRFSEEQEWYGRLSSGYETNGNLVRGESQLGFSNEQLDLSVFASWSQGDDYLTGNEETVQADFSRGSFGVNAGLKLSASQQLRISTTYNRARDADFPALPMDLRDDDTWMFNARHDVQFNRQQLQAWNTTIFGSFVDHLMDNRLKQLDPRMLNASTNATTANYGGRTEGTWQFRNNRLYAGADLRIEGAEGIRTREFLLGPMAGNTLQDNAWQDGQISKTGLFAEYQIKGGVLDYILSGRLELNTADLNDPTEEFTLANVETQVTQLNPSFSFGVLKNFDEQFRAGLWLARAQRSGGLAERFINYFPIGQDPFEMLGNPQLEPEVNYQADLNLNWKPTKGSIVSLDLYVAYLEDFISSVIDTSLSPRLPMSPGVRRFVNIDQALKTGFEVSWQQDLFVGLTQKLGLAYTYGQDLQRDEPLPEIAPLDLRYSLRGSYLKDQLSPELTLRYVAEQDRTSTEFGETITPSFALVDLKVGYSLSDKISISVGANNLLDENYYEHLNRSVRGTNTAIFAPGRNIFTNINFQF